MKVKKIKKKRGQTRYNWDEIMDQDRESFAISAKMGSDGSAKVARIRLMKIYNGVIFVSPGTMSLSISPDKL